MRRGAAWLLLLLVLVGGSLRAGATESVGDKRLALVVGNAAYRAGPLATAAEDAGLVAQSLAQGGFDVLALGDPDRATLRKTVAAFVEKVRQAGPHAVVFVYLSGYGLQYAGNNYFVPIDAAIDKQSDVPVQAVPLTDISQAIEALPARARLFVYDLARQAPFATFDTSTAAFPLAGGLTLVRPPHGSLYAFNAAPGRVGRTDVPPYGLYARALAEMLRTPGLTPAAVFARVRLRVAEVTGGAVIPWDEADLDRDVALVPAGAGPLAGLTEPALVGLPVDAAYWTAVAQDTLSAYTAFLTAFPDETLAARVKAIVAVRLEAATWSESVRSDSPAAYWTYMQRYPRGPHYVDVRRRLAARHAPLEPPPRFDPYDFAALPAPTPDQIRIADRPELASEDADGLPSPRVPEALLPPPSAAIYIELAPPPLVPIGVLPVPAPFAVAATRGLLEVPGPIVQPFVPGLGSVSIQSRMLADAAAMSVSTDVGLVTRTVAALENGRRTIVQTDAADEIVSRTIVTRADGPLVTMIQTGSDGALLAKIVTRIDPLGERSTTVTNARDQLVAETRANRWGAVTETTHGDGVLDAPTFVFPASVVEPPPSPVVPSPAPAVPAPVVLAPAPLQPTMRPAMPPSAASPAAPQPSQPRPALVPQSPSRDTEPDAVPLPVRRPPAASFPAAKAHLPLHGAAHRRGRH